MDLIDLFGDPTTESGQQACMRSGMTGKPSPRLTAVARRAGISETPRDCDGLDPARALPRVPSMVFAGSGLVGNAMRRPRILKPDDGLIPLKSHEDIEFWGIKSILSNETLQICRS